MSVGTLVLVGARSVSLGLFAVLVGPLSVLLDVAPAEVGLLVMQPSRPVVRLGRFAACLGDLVPFLLYVSVGSLLEQRRAAHLLRRITMRNPPAATYPIAVLLHSPRPSFSFLDLLGDVVSTVTGLTRPLACLGQPSKAPPKSLVVVASDRWNRHTDQHRTTHHTMRRPANDAPLLLKGSPRSGRPALARALARPGVPGMRTRWATEEIPPVAERSQIA